MKDNIVLSYNNETIELKKSSVLFHYLPLRSLDRAEVYGLELYKEHLKDKILLTDTALLSKFKETKGEGIGLLLVVIANNLKKEYLSVESYYPEEAIFLNYKASIPLEDLYIMSTKVDTSEEEIIALKDFYLTEGNHTNWVWQHT